MKIRTAVFPVAGFGTRMLPATKAIPKEMISKNTYDVDSISGASAKSRALKEAVKDAMNKI